MAELKVKMQVDVRGMTTCKVCGRDFPLISEDHYVSKEPGKTGFAAIAGGSEPILWDSFDCPHCGCQNRMQQRNRMTDLLGRDFSIGCPEEDDDEEDCCCCGSDACELNRGEQE